MSTDPEDEASVRLATLTGPRIDELSRWMAETSHAVPERSHLSGDDKFTAPYQGSQAAALALNHAVDNLAALKTLTIRPIDENYEVVLRPYAANPLFRAAFENACIAVWLLGPDERSVRVGRRFRLLLSDGDSQDAVAKITGYRSPDEFAKRWAHIQSAMAKLGIAIPAKERRRVGMASVVRAAATHLGRDPKVWDAVWHALSGSSHGDLWASMSVARFEPIGEPKRPFESQRPLRSLADSQR